MGNAREYGTLKYAHGDPRDIKIQFKNQTNSKHHTKKTKSPNRLSFFISSQSQFESLF